MRVSSSYICIVGGLWVGVVLGVDDLLLEKKNESLCCVVALRCVAL